MSTSNTYRLGYDPNAPFYKCPSCHYGHRAGYSDNTKCPYCKVPLVAQATEQPTESSPYSEDYVRDMKEKDEKIKKAWFLFILGWILVFTGCGIIFCIIPFLQSAANFREAAELAKKWGQ